MSTAIRFPSTAGLELTEAKQTLRAAVREYRAHLSARQRQAAAAAFAEHGELAVGDARCVAAYVANTTEPDTGLLLEALHARGVRVLLPVLGPGLARDWGEFRGTGDLERRAPGRPPEPSGPALGVDAVAEADVIIAPALAIDGIGIRLGQGGGWYDRALLTRRPGATVFGMVHEAEHVTDRPLPRAEHDIRVDAVITQERWFHLEGSTSRHGTAPAG